MDLIKELLTTPTQVEESETHYSNADYDRFNKIFDLVHRDLEHLSNVLRPGASIEKLSTKIGGDPAILAEARALFEKFNDAMLDLQMDVGMAASARDEETK